MNSAFSSRLTELRKKRGISQKEAAADLGISQALLSHYEKGIRECNLDFVCKLSSYYDVTCDYLLGQTDARWQLDEAYVFSDIAQDEEFRVSTLFRAAASLYENLSESAAGMGDKVKNYYAISIYRMAICAAEMGRIPKDWLGMNIEKAAAASLGTLSMLSDKHHFGTAEQKDTKHKVEPTCVKTVIENSEQVILKQIQSLIDEK